MEDGPWSRQINAGSLTDFGGNWGEFRLQMILVYNHCHGLSNVLTSALKSILESIFLRVSGTTVSAPTFMVPPSQGGRFQGSWSLVIRLIDTITSPKDRCKK